MAIPLLAPAHLKANAFVQSFQNPFGSELSKIIDPINEASKSGTLTAQQVQDALTTFNQQWTAFQQAAQQFRSQGGDYAKVVSQAYDPNGAFMKTVTGVQNTLQNYQLQLGPAPTDNNQPPAPPDPNNPNGTGGQSATQAARAAAVNQQRRNLAAPGFISTIMGGAGLNPQLMRKQLVGY